MKAYKELTETGKIRRLRRLALKVLEQYDLPVSRIRFFAIETNTMFRIDTPGGKRYMLRIYSNDDSTLMENQAEMYWLTALLRDTNLHVTRPIINQNGEYITIEQTPGIPEEQRCAIFEWIPGNVLERSLSPKHYFELGKTMAQLHDHAASLNPPENLEPKKWNRVFYYPDEPIVYDKAYYRQYFSAERIK